VAVEAVLLDDGPLISMAALLRPKGRAHADQGNQTNE
jgi:hypothetical protein